MADQCAKYSCTNCQDDIPGIRVHCVECTDFDLCIQCFATGAEIGPHRNNHKYQLTDSAGTVPPSRSKGAWPGCEELRLLEAIEKLGFGNWEDVSKEIKSRTPDEARDEYLAKYLNGCIGRNTWPLEQLPRLVDHTHIADDGPLSQLLTQRLPPIDATVEESSQLQYMPSRNDFDQEYDPTAEKLISSLILNPADGDETVIVLQLAQIDIYTRKLRERTRRKRMVQDYQLIAQYFRGAAAARRRHTKDQREFRDRFRVFAQFCSAVEFNRRLAGFERERALRVRLSELYRYRWNGLQHIADAVHFEQHAAVLHVKSQGPYGQQGKTDQASGELLPSFTHCPPRRTAAAHGESEKLVSSSSIGQKFTHLIGDPGSSDGLSLSRNYSDSTLHGPFVGQTAVVQQPGGQLLSTSEIHLCTNLNLPATRYVTIKTVMLSGGGSSIINYNNQTTPSLSNGSSSAGAGAIETAVRNFLTKAGWLKHSSAT